MQGLGTLVVTLIAIWGVFFTDLPATIIRQLQSEVADTKEDLVLLKREKQMLLEDVHEAEAAAKQAEVKRNDAEAALASAQADLRNLQAALDKSEQDLSDLTAQTNAVRAERDTAATELQALREQIEAVRREVAKITSERNKYLGTAFGNAVEGLNSALSAEIKQLTGQLDRAKELRDIPLYLARDKELKERLKGVTDRTTWKKIYEEVDAKYEHGDHSGSWLFWALGEPPTEADVRTIRAELIQQSRTNAPDGITILSRVMERDQFDYLLDSDWRKFNSMVQSIVKSKKGMLLSAPLRVTLPQNLTDEDLSDQIAKVQKAISDLDAFRQLMSDQLPNMLARS